MYKFIFTIILFITSLNSATLITFEYPRHDGQFGSSSLCAKSYYLTDSWLYTTDFNNVSTQTYLLNRRNFQFDDSYSLNENNQCTKDYSNNFGLKDEDFNFLLALTGLLIGFMTSNILLKRF